MNHQKLKVSFVLLKLGHAKEALVKLAEWSFLTTMVPQFESNHEQFLTLFLPLTVY